MNYQIEIEEQRDLDDGFIEELQKVRDKTFTPELRELVDRISRHEKHEDEKSRSGSREADLLRDFHHLFYKSINLAAANRINPLIGRFPAIDEDNSGDSLVRRLNSSGLGESLILTFDFDKKCYVSTLGNMDGLDGEAIFIDTSERLYRKILESPYGFFLTAEEIVDDPYLKKRFFPSIEGEHTVLYFLSVKRLLASPAVDLGLDEYDFAKKIDLLPVLMIRFSHGPKGGERGIFRVVNNEFLNVARYENARFRSLKKRDSLADLLFGLEYCYRYYEQRSGSLVYCIYSPDFNRDISIHFFITRYLCEKLRRELPGGTLVSQVSKDRILLFSPGDCNDQITAILGEFRKIIDDYSLETWQFRKNADFYTFLRRYIIQ